MRVADEQLGAGQGEAAAVSRAGSGDAGGVPAQRRLGPGERGLGLAGGDPRQPFPALRRGEPASAIAAPPSNTVDKNGPGMTRRPISSISTTRSTSPSPLPPSASG